MEVREALRATASPFRAILANGRAMKKAPPDWVGRGESSKACPPHGQGRGVARG